MEDIFKTNKAYLFQYRKKMEKIQRLEDKLAQINSDIISLKSPVSDGMPRELLIPGECGMSEARTDS